MLCLPVLSFAQNSAVDSVRRAKAVENVLVDAVSYMNSGDAQRALNLLESLRKAAPSNDAVHYYIGLCNYALGNMEAAGQALETAVSLDGKNNWYKENLAIVYGSLHREDKMTAIYEDLMREAPNVYSNAQTLTLLGDKALRERKDSLALSRYEQALSLDPSYAYATLGKIEVYRMQGNNLQFLSALSDFARDPSLLASGKVLYLREVIKHVDGPFYRAWHSQLDSLVTAPLIAAPADSAALRFAGEWFYGTERKELGEKYFARWAELYPQSIEARKVQMELSVMNKDYAKALAQAEPLLKLAGKTDTKTTLQTYSIIGDIQYELGNASKAFKAYDKALKIDPEYVPVLNNYAYYLSVRGEKLRKAEKMSRITIEKEPDNATYLDTYGWILHLLGKNDEAKIHFKKAMIYGGKDSKVILNHYSEVLSALGEKDLAKYYKGLSDARKDEK